MMKWYCFSVLLAIAVSEVYSGAPPDKDTPPSPSPDPKPPKNPISCLRPNEHYECGSACQTTCWNYNETCPIVNIRCNDDCYCNEGTARDDTQTCVPIKSCHWRSHGLCDVNEEYRRDSFVNNECIRTKAQVVPVWGCFCIKGHKREREGGCIPEAECHKKKEPETKE